MFSKGGPTFDRTKHRCLERSLIWPCFGRERDPTSPNRTQRRGPRRRVNRLFSLGGVGPRGDTL